ncbi:MAG TPA: hypothetical protein VGP87_15615 [Gemmatimonadales bacterium]|nr:hypothetical protein [Gemmatimonadales bacterium]
MISSPALFRILTGPSMMIGPAGLSVMVTAGAGDSAGSAGVLGDSISMREI